MTPPEGFGEQMADTFAAWMHAQGYTNNPDVTIETARLMATAYMAGATFGAFQAMDKLSDAISNAISKVTGSNDDL